MPLTALCCVLDSKDEGRKLDYNTCRYGLTDFIAFRSFRATGPGNANPGL